VKTLARINRAIFQALKEHSTLKDTSKRTIYRKIGEIRKQIGTWHSKRAAAAYFASTLGIDVHKLLKDKPEQLLELQNIGIPHEISEIKVIKRNREPASIKLDQKIIQTHLIPRNIVNQANTMANVYPHFYVFENILRYVIMNRLENKYGKKWWNTALISKNIKESVKNRKRAEGKARWVGRRGSHNIFYTDLGDLALIINTNWNDFKDFFPNLTWIKSRVEDLEKSRNILAHNNPLPNREIKRILLYVKDLENQLAESCRSEHLSKNE
jgi:hypothetical protein